jgi:hypothetical protein
MPRYFHAPSIRTSMLCVGLLFVGLTAGCKMDPVNYPKTVDPQSSAPTDCGEGTHPPCTKLSVPAGHPSCANGGARCAFPGEQLCSPPIGGKCYDVVYQGTCYCSCAKL